MARFVETPISARPRRNELVWETRGFEAFRAGTFGNGGQNLYVSRAGALQRIFQYDLTHNGRFDLVFCNSQNHCESAPTLVLDDPLGAARRTLLPGRGVSGGIACDLTGNAWLDLVLACQYDGMTVDLNSVVYYGGPEGYSEKYMNFLPTPGCVSLAAGDFTGAGRPSLAFAIRDGVRLFYQGDLGIEARRYTDMPLAARQVAAADLDGDGFAELIRRDDDGVTWVHWGGPDGIDPERVSRLPATGLTRADFLALRSEQSAAEGVDEPEPLLQVVPLAGCPAVTVITRDVIRFFTASSGRSFSEALALPCPHAQAAAPGRLAGTGFIDLAVAARRPEGEGERSRVYWGGPDGWLADRFTEFETFRACDVAAGDVNGDGRDELLVCQSHDKYRFTTESLVFSACAPDHIPAPARFATDDARRALALPRPDGAPASAAFINRYSRSLVGHDSVRVYTGGADGYRPDRFFDLPAHCAVEALYADVNDDGRADLVVVNCAENALWMDPGSFVYLNGPGGFDPERRQALPTRAAHGAVCADFDRDGWLDLAFASFTDPHITIFRGGPEGFDTKNPRRIPLVHKGKTYGQPRFIYVADLTNNGWLDLVIPQITFDRSFVLWGGPEGWSFDRCQELAVFRGCCARAADFTGNGYLDLVIGGHMTSPVNGRMPPSEPHNSFVYIYWNGPEGLSESRRTTLRADGVDSMAIADFNGDGRLDLFVGSYSNTRERDIDSFLYWNREGVGFANADVTRLRTHSVAGSLAADFDGDGHVDLAVANHKVFGDHKAFSAIWWNGPDGFDPKRTTRLPTDGPHGITTVEPGNQLTRGPEEYYTSAPYRLPAAVSRARLQWDGEAPPGTAVRGRLRQARREEELSRAEWSAWRGADEEFAFPAPADAFAQYQLALAAEMGLRTPRITAVRVVFGL